MLFLLVLTLAELQNQRLTTDWLSPCLAGQYLIVTEYLSLFLCIFNDCDVHREELKLVDTNILSDRSEAHCQNVNLSSSSASL